MPQPNGYAESGDQVILTMTREDYLNLLFYLGSAVGFATRDGNPQMLQRSLEFVNRLNQGNPNYTPYATT